MKKLTVLLMSLLFIGSQNIAFAGNISFDQVALSNDITVAKYNADLNTIYTDYNSNVQTSNIKDGTLLVGDFDSSSSPQVRTDEGAACDFVYSGLISSTTSGTLTGSISSGTAYPVGYRINKASSTPKTFTASKWTYVDLDFNGNFNYQEVAIGGATPTTTANSLRLERVSTDGTQIVAVSDLRKISCTSGPFSALVDTTDEATLDDILKNGAFVRRFSPAGRTPNGYARGFFVSFDTTTTFKVTSGAAYINGKYRAVSTDTTVTTGNDDPTNGVSGLDTGSVTGGPKTFFVYGVADQDSVKTSSFTYSTSASAPTGVTNSRLLGSIRIDNNNLFTSYDTVTAHGIGEKELIGAWVNFDGDATVIGIRDSFNVSGLTDNGTGDYTITIDADFNNANYAVVGTCGGAGNPDNSQFIIDTATTAQAAGVVRVACTNTSNARTDADKVNAIMAGDTRR